jgi:hypothetical protein
MRTTGPGQPERILLDVADLLMDFGVPYAVVGALAVSFYGLPRATTDADIVVWMTGTGRNAEDLRDRLAASGYRAELRRGDPADPILQSIRIEDGYENRMDLLLGIRGMDPAALGRCLTAAFFGSTVRIIAAEDLVGMKIFAGGFQDLEDVRGILQVSRERLSPDLLRQVARRYGPDVARTLDQLLDEFPLADQ